MFKEQEEHLIETGEIGDNKILFKINLIENEPRFLDKVPEKIKITDEVKPEQWGTYIEFCVNFEKNFKEGDSSRSCKLETPRFDVEMEYKYYVLLKTLLEFTVSPTQERLSAAQNIVGVFLSYILSNNKFDKGAIKEIKQIPKQYYHNEIVKAIKECVK